MRARWVACALVVVTALVWSPLLGNDFVNYDDDLYVTLNPQVRRGLEPESIAWAFTSTHGANYFPLTRLSWMLDAQLFGVDARAFHASSLALHILATLLLFGALRALTGALWRSAFVAAVFALHPLHVESVAWVAARKDVLSGCFAMGVLWAWALYARGVHPARAYALAAAALASGLLAKQVLVTLPFALLLLDDWPLDRLRRGGRLDRARLGRAVLEKLPLLAIAAAAGALAAVAQQSWGTIQDLERVPMDARVANALVSTVAYLGDAVWPSGLAVFYPYAAVGPGEAVAAGLLLAAITALSAAWWRRRRWLGVGWLFFAGSLVPVIGLVQIGQAARADRYMYLPLIGLAIPVAWGLEELTRRGRRARGVASALALSSLAGLAAATHIQLGTWRDSEALFRHALRATDRNHVAHLNLGLALMNGGRLGEAEPHLEAAARLAPSSPMMLGILAELRLRQHRWAEAADGFRAALGAGDREAARWHAGLAQALSELGHGEAALASYRRAVRGRPQVAELRAALGRELLRAGRRDEALESYREALRLDPDLAAAHGPMARLLAERGDLERALEHADAALRAEPDSGALLAERGRLHQRAGRAALAVRDYRAALGAGARDTTLLNDLAWLLATSPDPELASPGEAVALAEEAASRRRAPEILDTLSVAYAAAGRRDEAVRVAREALRRAEAGGKHALAASLRARLEDGP